MDSPLWVLDTNVIVSGFLSASGPPGRLLDAVLNGQLTLALDDRVEAEYAEVLARPKFGLRKDEIAAFLLELGFHERPDTIPILPLALPDPDDLAFVQLAMATREKILVTGNSRHFPEGIVKPVRVLTPAAAWSLLCGGN